MNYKIRLSSQARLDLLAFSPTLQDHLLHELDRFKAEPVTLSRKAHFPYPENCQLFRPAPLFVELERHEFMVLFRYGQDEQTLEIIGIGHYVTE